MPYYFRDRGKVYGPYTAQQVRSMRANGLLNNLTPFTIEQPQSQRVGAIVALAALFAIIALCVALFVLLQKPLQTQATSTTPAASTGGGTVNSPASAVPSVSSADNGAGEASTDSTDSTDSGASETPGDSAGEIPNAEAETSTDSTTPPTSILV